MAQSTTTQTRAVMPATSAAQQGDNIAHALAGAGGGLLSMTLTLVLWSLSQNKQLIFDFRYPLITLSTRAQVESRRAQSSTLDSVRHIIQREGIAGLYSGLDSALFGISVTNFVYYYCTLSISLTRNVAEFVKGTNGPVRGLSAPPSKQGAPPRI